jgi:hypothetical protein
VALGDLKGCLCSLIGVEGLAGLPADDRFVGLTGMLTVKGLDDLRSLIGVDGLP